MRRWSRRVGPQRRSPMACLALAHSMVNRLRFSVTSGARAPCPQHTVLFAAGSRNTMCVTNALTRRNSCNDATKPTLANVPGRKRIRQTPKMPWPRLNGNRRMDKYQVPCATPTTNTDTNTNANANADATTNASTITNANTNTNQCTYSKRRCFLDRRADQVAAGPRQQRQRNQLNAWGPNEKQLNNATSSCATKALEKNEGAYHCTWQPQQTTKTHLEPQPQPTTTTPNATQSRHWQQRKQCFDSGVLQRRAPWPEPMAPSK